MDFPIYSGGRTDNTGRIVQDRSYRGTDTLSIIGQRALKPLRQIETTQENESAMWRKWNTMRAFVLQEALKGIALVQPNAPVPEHAAQVAQLDYVMDCVFSSHILSTNFTLQAMSDAAVKQLVSQWTLVKVDPPKTQTVPGSFRPVFTSMKGPLSLPLR